MMTFENVKAMTKKPSVIEDKPRQSRYTTKFKYKVLASLDKYNSPKRVAQIHNVPTATIAHFANERRNGLL